MTSARFIASPESRLLLAAIRLGLGLLPEGEPPEGIPFARAKELGVSSGLLPWVLELMKDKTEEAVLAGQQYRELCAAVLGVQTKSMLRVTSGLRDVGIPAPAFKGIAYAASPHGGGAIFNDIDILIPRNSVEAARTALAELGYSQNIVSHGGAVQLISGEAIQSFEVTHYELFPFTRIVRTPEVDYLAQAINDLGLSHPFIVEKEQVYVAIELDIHHNLSLGIEADAVLACVREAECCGSVFSQLDWETHVWFVAARLYHEVMVLSAQKMRPLVDIGRVLAFAELDWERVMNISKTYALSPSLYYPLCWLSEQLPGTVPGDILRALDSDRVAQGLHDFGDFIPKMLGQKVLLRPA